jgi:hypothetical protein
VPAALPPHVEQHGVEAAHLVVSRQIQRIHPFVYHGIPFLFTADCHLRPPDALGSREKPSRTRACALRCENGPGADHGTEGREMMGWRKAIGIVLGALALPLAVQAASDDACCVGCRSSRTRSST